MNRRTALALLAAAAIPTQAADPESDAWETVAQMAAALADDNAEGFLNRVDPSTPGYDDLTSKIRAMLQQADVHSSISPLRNEGDAAARTLELDWELRLTRKSDGSEPRMDVREQAVILDLRLDRKRWRASKIDPLSFFDPPDFH